MVRVHPSGLDSAGRAWGDPGGADDANSSGSGNPSGSNASAETGCLQGSNCCVIVPQDQWYAVERFGKFQRILSPGLHFAGLDCFGICLGFRSIGSRISQTFSDIVTKTKDNVFVTLQVATQHSVGIEGASAAMYKMANRDVQIDAFVNDVVRSEVPQMSLDEAFEQRDSISSKIECRLQKEMAVYGMTVHKVLIIDLTPDSEVIRSMNEINKQRRLKDAVAMQSEAMKIRTIKAAEAAADAQHLSGMGIARQRRAIIQGLEDGITQGGGQTLSLATVKELLLATQYHETLKSIAIDCKEQAVFLPYNAGHLSEVSAQIRKGIQASAAPGQVQM